MHQLRNLCPTKWVKVNGLCWVCYCLSQSRIIDILAHCTYVCVASKGGVEGGVGLGLGVLVRWTPHQSLLSGHWALAWNAVHYLCPHHYYCSVYCPKQYQTHFITANMLMTNWQCSRLYWSSIIVTIFMMLITIIKLCIGCAMHGWWLCPGTRGVLMLDYLS